MNYLIISKIAQIVLGVLITVLVLIQSKNAGLTQGLKGSFGAYRSLRGVEKLILYTTIALGVLLVINSFILMLLS
ncbi:preprotein translocase subunit SecG [candidate division WWE3 bacterium RIFOXYC1_FULL_40_10]|uniref:Protein-export membrane protein SecG n=1 Tax=candidate division WWE3 bacterium RIFOXYA2_FULL_46_9 TaxID=1802636 RepID=A0A1F4W391_UNCKA|nr:MAG: preprotein translocase subunit SecG [candidate division WWE3 bacterium RIFOXYB1_FULL_40_22]OGC61765.1 MAG: preprotein translocase subunit SecG [candidate division WWE3 bacterium RIFOXYA1_FULL_40_11]OGC63748.1 MAG: preprotein translocase subunit SecG [candidate division WWE3 bacterium RIFOXYA2_FULL_46_9]OGC65185.1 MAG: preprotein translocase subunit SecG [candidate division WWE3 bacterium RIFOXYB2_FULL_41_6]OGC66148.1 MAG: preprotein translocase subunit SecG [candidate division WWE3 bact